MFKIVLDWSGQIIAALVGALAGAGVAFWFQNARENKIKPGAPIKSPAFRWKCVVGSLFALGILWYLYDFPHNAATLLPHGKAAFYHVGIFNRDEHGLSVFRSHWWIDGDHGGELNVPFESDYNGRRMLCFEEGGRVYLLDKKNSTRTELRVVNGEWSYDASDHWQSLFDDVSP